MTNCELLRSSCVQYLKPGESFVWSLSINHFRYSTHGFSIECILISRLPGQFPRSWTSEVKVTEVNIRSIGCMHETYKSICLLQVEILHFNTKIEMYNVIQWWKMHVPLQYTSRNYCYCLHSVVIFFGFIQIPQDNHNGIGTIYGSGRECAAVLTPGFAIIW